MTLKTTKEQREALLIKLDDPDFAVYNTVTVYNSVARDLCHDAGRAGELEKELIAQDQNVVDLMNQVAEMSKENADLRAKLDEVIVVLKTIEQRAANNMDDRETVYAIHSLVRRALKEQEKV